MADSLPAFFSLMEEQGNIVVKGTPKLDLDLYIHNYRGRTRFDRLFLIGRTSQVLCIDALKAAVYESKRGRDVRRYRTAVECLRTAAPSEPEAVLDQAWIDQTEMFNKGDTHRLEGELRGYKNNLIKESVRMGNEDLGRHYESIGDINKALEAYSRMRSDISTPKHIVDVGKHLVRVSLQRRDWATVTVNANKMVGNLSTDEEKALQPYLKVVLGIALLGQENYHDAVLSFLQTDPAIPSSSYNEIASPNDVAVYGGLLALASMDRKDLQAKVLENAKFRSFLELEPQLRRAIAQFVNGRYSACLAILESYRPDYLIDIYLQPHVQKIYEGIRSKCIVQYLVPFSCVTLESMNAAFAAPGETIEEELVSMIQSGTLQARFDAIDKLVTTVSVNSRLALQSKALATVRSYEKEALESIRRMSLIAADLEVKGPRKFPGSSLNLGQSGDGQLSLAGMA